MENFIFIESISTYLNFKIKKYQNQNEIQNFKINK